MSRQALTRNPLFPPTQVLGQLQSGQLLYIKSNPGNGLIICHPHYSELVGPGSIVGGVIDLDCSRLVPLGKVALTYPESFQLKKEAFQARQKWLAITQKIVKNSVPLQRANLILVMMERYFGLGITESLDAELLASIVGVVPSTIELARQYHQKQKTQGNSGSSAVDSSLPVSQ